ncbi:MAG: hypothetical protein XU11_C0027G0023 [Candidatus Dadabacteria bacterium CSP1-2]|nr:MAG: hypothetical protein XU11_C0027G0023 [Candidatus Dadabacteria bacterium CSP1-2]
MTIKLLDLRKFAIEKRVDVGFKDKNSSELCVVDKHGIAKIPVKNTFKEPFHIDIEGALKTATEFIIEDGKEKQVITVEEIAEMIADVLKPKTSAGHGPTAKKEED